MKEYKETPPLFFTKKGQYIGDVVMDGDKDFLIYEDRKGFWRLFIWDKYGGRFPKNG